MGNDLDLFAYLDYQLYLRDWFGAVQAKKPLWTMQYVAEKLQLKSRGYFFRVLNDASRPMSDSLSERLSDLIGHDAKQAEYWKALVKFGRAKDPLEARKYYREVFKLQGNRHIPSRTTDRYEFFRHWYLPAIRELAVLPSVQGNPKTIAKLLVPAISVKQAKEGLDLLVRLGFLLKNDQEQWEQSDPVLHGGHDFENTAILEYQESLAELATQALFAIPRNQREYSTVTLGMPTHLLPQVQQLARKFQNDLVQLVVGSPEPIDSVYHLNLQFFPLGLLPSENSK